MRLTGVEMDACEMKFASPPAHSPVRTGSGASTLADVAMVAGVLVGWVGATDRWEGVESRVELDWVSE